VAYAPLQYISQPAFFDLLHRVLSCYPDALCVYDDRADLVYANDAFMQLWALNEKDLAPERNAQRLAQQLAMVDRGSVDALVDAPREMSESIPFYFRDGRVFNLLALSFKPQGDAVFTLRVWRNQPEEVTAHRKLEEQYNLLKSLTNLLPDQLFFKDIDLRYTEVNESFLVHNALESSDSILGFTDFALFTKEYAQRSAFEELDIIRSGKPMISQLREYVRIGGQRAWAQTTKLPRYNSAGEIDGIFGFLLDVTDKQRNEELIWRQANYDHLTQLPNRRLLAERWHSAWQAHLRDPKGLGLLLINLDQFKMINDSLGFQVGELLLVSVAERLRRCTRSKDSIARLSADEFVVLATDIKSDDDLNVVINKVMAQFEEPFILDRQPVVVNASVGVALAPNDGEDLDEVMLHADQALHESKRVGGKTWRRFSNELKNSVSKQFSLANDLRYAIKNQEFSINFQPIVDLQSKLDWVKVETLIRWHHPKRGWVSPVEFIPVAEQTGLIVEIGEWVYQEAIERLAEIQTATGLSLIVSINVSPRQLKAEGFNPDIWVEKAQNLGVNPHNIVVEITEGMFLDPDEKVIGHLDRFSELGVKISLDDFGTGYASISFLENFSVDVLKLDRAFVNDAEKTPRRRVLAEAIINMAAALELEVVAEGIETEAQSQWLISTGCQYGQGYLYSKPITPGKLQQQLLEQLNSASKGSG